MKEKLNDRRIAEPPMDENSKKIRELTEAMHAERDIRIRNRMMAVLEGSQGPLDKGSPLTLRAWISGRCNCGLPDSTRAASVASGTLPDRGRASTCKVRADQETGRQACRQEHAHPQKASKPDTRETRCLVQSVQRAQDPALPRVLVQEACCHACLGSRC